MKRTILTILAAAAILALAGPGPSRAGTEVTLRLPVVDGVKVSLGLRVESRSISLDGILFFETDEKNDATGQTGGRRRPTVHTMRAGDYPNFFTAARTCVTVVSAVQQTAGRITRHWIERTILKRNQPKGSGDADSR